MVLFRIYREGQPTGASRTTMKLSTFVTSLFFCSVLCAEASLGSTNRDFDAISKMTAKELADYGKNLNAHEINEIVDKLWDYDVSFDHLAHLLDDNSLFSEETYEEWVKFGTDNDLQCFAFVHSLSHEKRLSQESEREANGHRHSPLWIKTNIARNRFVESHDLNSHSSNDDGSQES